MALPERLARLEYKKVADREASLLRVDVDFKPAVVALDRKLARTIQNFPERVSKHLAGGIRAGDSTWRVRTGYSRSRFKGDRRGIINDASYAPYLEERYKDAERYVRDNIQEVSERIVREELAKN